MYGKLINVRSLHINLSTFQETETKSRSGKLNICRYSKYLEFVVPYHNHVLATCCATVIQSVVSHRLQEECKWIPELPPAPTHPHLHHSKIYMKASGIHMSHHAIRLSNVSYKTRLIRVIVFSESLLRKYLSASHSYRNRTRKPAIGLACFSHLSSVHFPNPSNLLKQLSEIQRVEYWNVLLKRVVSTNNTCSSSRPRSQTSLLHSFARILPRSGVAPGTSSIWLG